MIHMEYYLIVSAIMFFAGIYGFFTRRNTLAILISIELILNATDINFAVFNRFLFPDGLEGYFFALFSIAISAAETAVAIAIMINIYRNIRSIQVNNCLLYTSLLSGSVHHRVFYSHSDHTPHGTLGNVSAVYAFRHSRHLLPARLHLPGISTNHGLCPVSYTHLYSPATLSHNNV